MDETTTISQLVLMQTKRVLVSNFVYNCFYEDRMKLKILSAIQPLLKNCQILDRYTFTVRLFTAFWLENKN